jgi:two-component system, OmpR family, phosphate regulon sensor histidine kinase PhoR
MGRSEPRNPSLPPYLTPAVLLLWFLLGILVSIVPAGWYYLKIHRKLRQLVKELGITRMPVNLWKIDQLTATFTAYHQHYQQFESQAYNWATIFKQSPVGYLQVDSENQLLWCNAIACQYLAIQRCQSDTPRLLLEVVRSYELDALIEQVRDTQVSYQRDWLFYPALELLPSPEQHTATLLRGSAFPLADNQVGIFLENRQEVAQLAQQRDRWVSDVAHELKTPLTSIRLVAEALQARLEAPHRQWIDRLLNETIRLSTMVQEFLDLSHLEVLPAHQLSLRSVDLIQLINSAWAGLEPVANTKGVNLNFQGPDQVIMKADEARLHRVFINLFDNSIKYSYPQHAIDLEVNLSPATAHKGAQVQIDLIDHGPGIPENDLPFIFERLYRADPSRARHVEAAPPGVRSTAPLSPSELQSTTTWKSALPLSLAVQPGSGSGLGLAIVRQIIEAHLGSVIAKNHPDTGGAWLQIHLPLE